MRRTLTLAACLLACALPWAAGCRTAWGPGPEAPPQPVSHSRKPTSGGSWPARQTATDSSRSDFAAHRSDAKTREPFEPIQQVAAPPVSGDPDGPLLPPPNPEPAPKPKPN